MTNDKSPEQAAEEYILSVMEDFPGELIEVGKPDLKVQARDLISIARNAYQRGKAEAEQRIAVGLRDRIEAWKVCPEHSAEPLGELTWAFIEQIIFGGGDDNK